MYAVLVTVDIDAARLDEATQMLNDMVIPIVKSAEGFVRGTWMRSADGTTGRGVLVFETEAGARAAAAQSAEGPPPGSPTTPKSIDVFEVIAEA